MRKSLATACLLLLAVAAANPLTAQRQQYTLTGLNGGSLGASDLNQGAVIAVVFASWSPRGKDVVNQVNSIVDNYGRQARVIMVNFQEDKSEVDSFLAGQKPKAKVYLDQDGTFSKQYSVTHLPGLLILKDGSTAFSGRLTRDSQNVISQTLG